ncbi:g10737 [Coccomyxa elongata]
MEPLLPGDSSPAPQQYCSLRTHAQAFPEETHELSHESPRGWRVTDIQRPAPAECHSGSMNRPENVGSTLYRHDSAASCAGGEEPGGPPLIGRGTVLPALQRGTSDLASPSKFSCSSCRECGRSGPRDSRRASGSPLEIDASRHVSLGEESDDQHEHFCPGKQHTWRDKSSGSSGRSPWRRSLRDAVQTPDNHGACQGDCSRRPSATVFPLDDLEPGTPPQPPRRSTLHSVPPGSRRSTLSHSSSLGRKLWHERLDADACSTSSQQASLPPIAAVPAVQWLPVVHPGGQVLALPALPAAHAGPAAAVADAQAERARDTLRLWKGATKWVALWLLLSVLTLLHAGALITAFYEVAIAKVCAVLFCWSGLLGMVGGIHALFAECFARQRSSAQAAADSLGLKAVALVAFMTAVLSSLAATVHMLVLQLFTRDAHLPPCAPDQRFCAETYNLLLVLMVATVVMYGVHAAVSAVVACKAHYARQVLRSPSHRSYYP